MNMVKWNRGFSTNRFGDLWDDFLGNESTGSNMPAVNVIENGDNYRIDVAAPGFKKDDFKVTVHNDTLTISVEKETESNEEKDNVTRREYRYGSFKRTFHLPDTIKGDKVNATYEDGILKIDLPKREEAKEQPQRLIEVG